MERHTMRLAGLGLWALLQGGIADLPLPPLPEDAPALVEVEGTYRALAEALRRGDAADLRRLTHSARRHLVPARLAPLPPEEARQYEACHVMRPLLRTQEDEITYLVTCEAAGERVDQPLILRRDRDGEWRILAF
jgi:hypothetical protein